MAEPVTEQAPADAWLVFLGLLLAGWTPAAIASAHGLPVDTLSTAAWKWRARGVPTRFAPRTAAALLAGPVRAPDAGHVPVLGSMRRTRALAASAWSCEAIADRSGLPLSVVWTIQTGRVPRVWAATAAVVTGTYVQLSQRAGASLGALRRAHALDWPPVSAWLGLDLDDPGVAPDGYPRSATTWIPPERAEQMVERRAWDRERSAARRAASRSR